MRRVGIAAAAALAVVLTMAGCGSEPLAITCGDYLKQDQGKQLELAARFGAPNRDHVGVLERSTAPAYRKELLRYCPTHQDDRLEDLELTIGPGP